MRIVDDVGSNNAFTTNVLVPANLALSLLGTGVVYAPGGGANKIKGFPDYHAFDAQLQVVVLGDGKVGSIRGPVSEGVPGSILPFLPLPGQV